MSDTQQLARIQQEGGLVEAPALVRFTPEDVRTIRATVAKDCNDSELALFLATCQHTGLNPLVRQIYAIKMQGRLTIHVGIDGYRLVAARTGRYAGQVGPQWCGEDGVWQDVWLGNKPPAACKVGILRTGFPEPVWAVATFKEFSKNTDTWKAMPSHMLAKVAESHALRRAFPNDLANLTPDFEDAPAERPVRMPRIHEEPISANLLPRPQLSSGGEEDLELRAAPAGPAPNTELKEARDNLFRAYKAAGGDTKDKAARARHVSLILEKDVLSWTTLTAAECRGLAHHLDEHGLPRERTEQAEALDLDDEEGA